MNEQLQRALAQVITKATEGVEAGVSFLSAEIPDVVHQLLMWKMVESIAFSILGIFSILLSLRLIGYSNKILKSAENDYNEGKGWCFFSSSKYITSLTFDAITSPMRFIPSAVAFIFGMCQFNLTWVQILIAPKIYLIEYAAQLVK